MFHKESTNKYNLKGLYQCDPIEWNSLNVILVL